MDFDKEINDILKIAGVNTSLFESLRDWSGGTAPTEIYKNPSKLDIINLFKSHPTLRVAIDYAEDTYVWDAKRMTHGDYEYLYGDNIEYGFMITPTKVLYNNINKEAYEYDTTKDYDDGVEIPSFEQALANTDIVFELFGDNVIFGKSF